MRTPAEISKEINDLDDRLWISNNETEIEELRAKLNTLNIEFDEDMRLTNPRTQESSS